MQLFAVARLVQLLRANIGQLVLEYSGVWSVLL